METSQLLRIFWFACLFYFMLMILFCFVLDMMDFVFFFFFKSSLEASQGNSPVP